MNWQFIREVGPAKWLYRTIARQWFKRVLRREHAIDLPTGGRFHLPLDSFCATEVYLAGADIDWGSEALFARLLAGSADGCLLDVGANIGYYSVYYAPLADRVYAFEPDEKPRRALTRNVVAHPNVEILSHAVGRRSGTARFSRSQASEISHFAAPDEDGVEVPVTAIDDFVAARGLRVAMIKTDIEGFDLEALEGARGVLQSQRPLVLSELQPAQRVSDFARDIDYRVYACARDRRTRARRFVPVGPTGRADLDYKMLCLFPCERLRDILAVARKVEDVVVG